MHKVYFQLGKERDNGIYLSFVVAGKIHSKRNTATMSLLSLHAQALSNKLTL